MQREKTTIFWFRRDLRLKDNHGLYKALKSNYPVLPIFIFDTEIIDELKEDDARVTFIYDQLKLISSQIRERGGDLLILHGKPIEILKDLVHKYDIQEVFTNRDYEPYAFSRDTRIEELLLQSKIPFHSYKDQVIFEKSQIVKDDGSPYTVFTPFKKKWLGRFEQQMTESFNSESINNYLPSSFELPTLENLGFKRSKIQIPPYDLERLENYQLERNIPSLDQTSHLSPHLRFGTVSIRDIVGKFIHHEIFLSELIWREFFMQILYHFPRVVDSNFKSKYDNVQWRNNKNEFEKWKNGTTGFPLVDAGMRQLNETGRMHNRVRMITAGFLCKHLLIDWRWGEAYFAEKLLDYDLALNNGNWQWSAGTGCDAAPYFRIFNPTEQVKKFDPELKYIRKWIPEIDSFDYPIPMIDHKIARERALSTYKEALNIESL